MWHVLGASVDFLHAAAMAAWIAGLPLLFLGRRWPRASRAYVIFALAFIVLNQASHYLLGECFLTTIARWLYLHDRSGTASYEWFTVRLAEAVFRMAPSHRSIVVVGQALVAATAVGALVWLHHRRVAHG
jgi:hypothetical protein